MRMAGPNSNSSMLFRAFFLFFRLLPWASLSSLFLAPHCSPGPLALAGIFDLLGFCVQASHAFSSKCFAFAGQPFYSAYPRLSDGTDHIHPIQALIGIMMLIFQLC